MTQANTETPNGTVIEIRRPDDLHVHIRQGPMLKNVLPFTAKVMGRSIMMPNTVPPILTGEDALRYKSEIDTVVTKLNLQHEFTPLMTIKITDATTPKIIEEAKAAGVTAGKIYPANVTTNSSDGLTDFESENIFATFKKMEEVGMLLLIHGESPEKKLLVTKRESAFIPTFEKLVTEFPDLKIVLEHISTADAVNVIVRLRDEGYSNVAATITAHHLVTTLNNVVGRGVEPHNMCMPIPKDYSDQDMLLWAAMSGRDYFFMGSDSAPHPREHKECAMGKCGAFTAPILMPLLADIFEQYGKLTKLENFTSVFGAEFYDIPLNEDFIELEKVPQVIPEEICGVVPFKAGEEISWSLV